MQNYCVDVLNRWETRNELNSDAFISAGVVTPINGSVLRCTGWLCGPADVYDMLSTRIYIIQSAEAVPARLREKARN